MVEFTGNIPFLWRLSPESSDGLCAVSMVVPYEADDDRRDLTIETSVVSFASDSSRAETEEMLEWNQDDISLFLKLVAHQQDDTRIIASDTVRIDLTDPAIIDIIHVVASKIEDRTPWLTLLTEDGTVMKNALARADEVVKGGLGGSARSPAARHPRNVRVLPKSRDFH